jgi:hypothetical protein
MVSPNKEEQWGDKQSEKVQSVKYIINNQELIIQSSIDYGGSFGLWVLLVWGKR